MRAIGSLVDSTEPLIVTFCAAPVFAVTASVGATAARAGPASVSPIMVAPATTPARSQVIIPSPSLSGKQEVNGRSGASDARLSTIGPLISATMETNKGAIGLELFDEQAPKTVANFTKLARDGFYDGVIFHRVIP